MQAWAVTALGAAVLAVGLRDVFHTLWHPSGHGGVSRRVMAAVWRAGRRARQQGRSSVLAGPLAMVVVVFTWVTLVVLGCTLVYWPHLPAGFVTSSELEFQEGPLFLDALYLSTVTVATLGFGDIVPVSEWLRVLVPLQALIGFALVTAAVTWVLQIYPALTRRRALAIRLSLLHRVDARRLVDDADSDLAAPVLESLATELVQSRVDLTQYSETYYFRDGDDQASLPAMLGVAVHLRGAAREAPRSDVRIAGELLGHAIDDFARIVALQFLRDGLPPDDVVDAYAADHGHQVTRP
ncbi:two pore domain potassium channel family protein [Modestobacter versicolor]|uniref:Two pore domain potassium channel family protein n=1 Tax=Modestobacter versicolor TaxID=429133 RepID=A0A323VDF9_9ACTN|nr:two pore domain potassium channel family protein [Modestobacter versicolor]